MPHACASTFAAQSFVMRPAEASTKKKASGGTGSPTGSSSGVALEPLVDHFVSLYANRHRQRTKGWLAMKAQSVGGSEIAALMGYNPYSSFDDIVASKAGVHTFTGNVACWWGTLFESAMERFIEIDCATRLKGTDISIPSPPWSGLHKRHANSPDGYGVVTLYQEEEEEEGPVWRILSTEAEKAQAVAEGRPTKRIIALFEIKCPLRRQPAGGVPNHYKPQLWSGLALSPIAHFGVFVDAAFRKCALWNLGHEKGYDRAYHRERKVARWTTPVAWGFTAVYAPEPDSLEKMSTEGGEASAAKEAWRLHHKNFGIPFESPQEAAKKGRLFAPDPIDFGDCDKSVFETMMLHLDKGHFQADHRGPCFPDGRGEALRTGREIGEAIDRSSEAAPARHYLLGVLPWKVFEVDYSFVERRESFLVEIAPLVHECLEAVERLRKEKDPSRAFSAYLKEKQQKIISKSSPEKTWEGLPDKSAQKQTWKNADGGGVANEQIQALFDAI
ncbi:BA71V-D345L (I3L, i4L) protein [Elysia marginata]|uniref:BA71V-D345L (I3L, i4L) protein n=1 Tax=Elysia marginata TaxID=1093978 RepID=A0AAV4GSL6_9GAST|nr:BA71V-D345L (I3L, i4L) protein [Elysia marginata]